MTAKLTKKNEDAPFYFEKLLASLDYLELLDSTGTIARLQIKPDRKYGVDRRIDDLTRFNRDKSIEVVQIKHSVVDGTKIGFSDLWISKVSTAKKGARKEGTNIFKFLKSWRSHRKTGCKKVTLTLVSNKDLTTKAKKFFAAIASLKIKKLSWRDFNKQYAAEIQIIKNNCSQAKFADAKELKEFVSSLNYRKVGDIDALHDSLEEKIKSHGITEKTKIDAFINRVTRTFISNKKVDILQSDVVPLIERVKTGLLHEIAAPENYVPRPAIEKKILDAIDSKKKDGGFVFLFSPSGSGKTVLLSRLSESNPDFLPYFCRIRPFEAVKGKTGYSNTNRLSGSWFKVDIIQRCNEFGLVDKTAGITDDANYIDKTFDEALSAMSKKALQRSGQKIVIIVDALDQVETDKYKDKSILDAIPSVQYPGVVFLLSTWGESYLPTSIKNLSNSTKKDSGIDLFFSEREIEAYFQNSNIHLTQDQIATVKSKTKGLAISLFYLAQKLKREHDVDSVIGSTGQYDKVFEWYKPIWASLGKDEQECLGCLCFHLAKVKTDDLRSTVKKSLTPTAFAQLLSKIDPFIDTRSGYIEPYHDSFRRFVVSSLSSNKAYYHKRLAEYYSAFGAQSPYGAKYITKHLESAGIGNSSVAKIYKKLDRDMFFTKILRLKIDDSTKVEIGKNFANFFYKTKNTKSLVRYSILTSNIYPTTYGDNSYKKAFIGTEKLIAEVETALMAPKSSHEHDQREWVFRRLSIGNLLKSRADKNSLHLASRFLDDGLFRFSLNTNLLWDENAEREFWSHASIITEAYVNTNQYLRALRFLKRGIVYKKKTKKITGFIASKVVDVHLQNLKIDRKTTLQEIAKASKIERLIFYIAIWKESQKITNKKDLEAIMTDLSVESYLSDMGDSHQPLDFAELLFAFGKKKYADRIKNILKKCKINVPHYSHGYAYWGDMGGVGRGTFLRYMSLRMLIEPTFDFKKYYEDSLKEQFKNRSDTSEYDNPGFVETLIAQITLRQKRLLVRSQKTDWSHFWKTFEETLATYKQKRDEVKSADPKDSYRSSLSKTHQPYLHDLHLLVEENLGFVAVSFPNKLEFAIGKIESILGDDYVKENTNISETIIRISDVTNTNLKDKVDVYLAALLEYRRSEILDNMTKSSNLEDLATLAASKGCQALAENIFEQSLKYSRGLWNKEDLRFYNFVDSARTQNKKELDLVLGHINKISDVVEGGWYWRTMLLESATYANYELALDYAYDFIVSGESSQNEALRKIVTTYIKFYPYSSIGNILPVAALIDLKEETGYQMYENISPVTYALIKAAIINNDLAAARKWTTEYFERITRDLPPTNRINISKDFINFASTYPELKKEVQIFEKHIKHLEGMGFKAEEKSSARFEDADDKIDLKKFKKLAKKNEVEKVIQMIDAYVKKPAYFVDSLVSSIVPFLSTTSIERIRVWAVDKKVDLLGSTFFIALVRKAVDDNNSLFLKKVVADIFKFQSEAAHFHSSHFIKELNNVSFPGKRSLIRRMLLVSINKYAGDGYSLPSLFAHSAEAIDDNMPELKEFSYEIWKEVVESSMKLSLSK